MRWTVTLVVLTLAYGCSTEGAKPSPTAEAGKATGSPLAADSAPKPTADPTAVAHELSDADKALIAADPETLTDDERRDRAQALRRKVMLNPDSPSARAIADLQQAIKDGTVEPPTKDREYPTLHLPGAEPEGGQPPAGTPPAGTRPAGTPPPEAP